MQQGNLSRRGFLQRSLTAALASGLPLWYAREVAAVNPARAKPDANGKIIMGAIGIGSPASRGRAIAHEALSAGKGNVVYVAVCDVDGRHRVNAAEDMKKHNQDVKRYEDFRVLLDNKDINAVTIATPDHWHALIAIEAMRKGKDVYCEKPLTLTVAEAQAVAKVAKQTNRVFQVGSQQRSDARFRLACELVRNGRLGKIKKVETRIGANPTSPALPKAEVPRSLDWDFWLGPTPEVDYVEMKKDNHTFTRCHYEFRWWYDYSGGKMTDWGAHHNDIAQWGLGMDEGGPIAVEATGEQPSKEPNSYNCHPHFTVTYTYPGDIQVLCMSDGDNGIRFEGEDGKWIFVDRGKILASDKKLLDEPLPSGATRLYVSNNHMGNFLECVKTRKPTICTADIGHRSVTVCHIGVIALRTGKKLKWDPVREMFDDEEANKMLSRPMRAPWKLEV
jgi:predicted dehydrogenase